MRRRGEICVGYLDQFVGQCEGCDAGCGAHLLIRHGFELRFQKRQQLLGFGKCRDDGAVTAQRGSLSGFGNIEATISPSSAARCARLLVAMTFASASRSLSANRSTFACALSRSRVNSMIGASLKNAMVICFS
jgi:hypothetical protein